MRNRAVIAGLASSAVGKLPGTTTFGLAAQVGLAAVADAGLEIGHVDGLLTTQPLVGGFARQGTVLAEYLGLSEQMRHCGTVSLGGASPLVATTQAAELVLSGQCRAVLVIAADTPRTGQDRSQSVGAFAQMRHPQWEQPCGLTNAAAYGLMARRYLDQHGHDDDELAAIPVAMRAHAHGQSDAVYRDLMTEDDVLSSRPIAEPLRLLECSPISDGGGAVLVTTEAIADGPTITGHAQGHRYDSVSYAGDLTKTGASISAERAFEASGLFVRDIDVALLYDSYSITLAVELEELGFCAPGTASAFVRDGGIGRDSATPVNPHGGLLSHSHCGGASGIQHIVESIRQLRGDAEQQIEGAATALVHAEGGIVSANCTAIIQA